MAIRVAINGFGRIGRNVLRAIAESGRKDIEVVGINDLGPVETNAHLLRFDSVHGRFPGVVTVEGDSINLGNGKIKKVSRRARSLEAALEGTRASTSRWNAPASSPPRTRLPPHPDRRRQARVLVSAPADADATIVYGVNHDTLTKDHLVVSNGSCTSNCLAPVAKVLNDTVGIETGFAVTTRSTPIPAISSRRSTCAYHAQGSLSRPRRG